MTQLFYLNLKDHLNITYRKDKQKIREKIQLKSTYNTVNESRVENFVHLLW